MTNDKKIGIITFHSPISYGAHLQCLALQLFLRHQGYDAEVIDYSMSGYLEYRSKHRLKSFIIRFIKAMPLLVRRMKVQRIEREKISQTKLYIRELKERDSKFAAFRDMYYHLSKSQYTGCLQIKKNPPAYDAYICGSDQIWNPYFCDSDDNYFLDFAPVEKRIAYAPSFGVSTIPWIYRRIYKNRLNDIPYLSIREKTGQHIIKNLTGRNAPIVIDPTFLIPKAEWETIAQQSPLTLPKRYILTYFIGVDNYIHDTIQKVKSYFHDAEVINLVFDQSSYGPCDFLKLISHADFVVTNSFHGMAFCLNFEVPFIITKSSKDMGKNNAFSRITDLLVSLGLEGRVIDNNNKLSDSYLNIDYNSVNTNRQHLCKQSSDFLLSSLHSTIQR